MKSVLIIVSLIASTLISPVLFASNPTHAADRAAAEAACKSDTSIPDEKIPRDWCIGGYVEGASSYCDSQSINIAGYSIDKLKSYCRAGVNLAKSSSGSSSSGTMPKKCSDRGLLGLPTWYRGIADPADGCAITTPDDTSKVSAFIWTIVLNVVEMVLVITAYIAVGFILYGGFLFITGGSNPGSVEKGRKTILNAVIGLVISLSAVAIVNLIFRIL